MNIKKIQKKEKVYKFKELLVGFIAIQSNVECDYFIEGYRWEYTPKAIGFFIKTPMGYKHILTDTYYPAASYKTAHKIVLVKKQTYPFTQYAPDLMVKLENSGMKGLTKNQIEFLEKKYTENLLRTNYIFPTR